MDPWSKEDYSWHIWEASMVWRSSRRSILPPAGCREEFFWCSRSWKRGDGGTQVRSRKRVLSSGVSGRERYIGKGDSQGGHQESRWPGGAAAPGGAPWPPFGRLEASGMLIFYIFFSEFLWHFK